MTHRKDYELIAKVIRDMDTPGAADPRDEDEWKATIASQLCLAFQEQHPQFRADLFMKACGIPQLHTLPRR